MEALMVMDCRRIRLQLTENVAIREAASIFK